MFQVHLVHHCRIRVVSPDLVGQATDRPSMGSLIRRPAGISAVAVENGGHW